MGAIIITGASVGIGAATAIALASRGSPLIITARRGDALENVAERVRSAGGEVRCVAGDICDEGTRAEIVAAALEFGGVDALVNNAGFGQPGPAELVPREAAVKQFEVNLFALMELTRLCLPSMRKQRRGRIVNVTSVLGRVSMPLYGWYCATKHALEALSDALREEVKGFGVKVIIVQPGPIRTEFGERASGEFVNLAEDESGDYSDILAAQRLAFGKHSKTGVSPDSVARAIGRAVFSARPCGVYRVTATTRMIEVMGWLLPRRVFGALMAKAMGFGRKASK